MIIDQNYYRALKQLSEDEEDSAGITFEEIEWLKSNEFIYEKREFGKETCFLISGLANHALKDPMNEKPCIFNMLNIGDVFNTKEAKWIKTNELRVKRCKNQR